VRLSPAYGDAGRTVYINGYYASFPSLWCSTDDGQNFTRYPAPTAPDDWIVADDNTVFLAGYDGSHGLVFRTGNGGLTFGQGTLAGGQPIFDIALSPSYATDRTVLLGNSDGWVYLSGDAGATFQPLPTDATSRPLRGNISVAFDPDYSANHVVYAASKTAGDGVYRLTVGGGEGWESIDKPTGAMFTSLVVSADNTLYAANAKVDSGMERCLDPSFPLNPTFENVTRGFDTGAILSGLWRSGNTLWAVDAAHGRLLTYADTLTRPLRPNAPANKAAGVGMVTSQGVKDISLDWEAAAGATEYEWALSDSGSFSGLPGVFTGTTSGSALSLPPLEPMTVYHWRVRACQPVLSPWSDTWSFTTALGGGTLAPLLESPAAGESGVTLRPVFQWDTVAGADAYELMLATDAAFVATVSNQTGDTSLPANAWRSTVGLDYGTTYYWKVRAVGRGTSGPWSAVGAFTTGPQPVATVAAAADPSAAPAATSQAASGAMQWPSWVFPVGGAVLLTFLAVMIAILVTLLVLTARISRL
jgi:hypothetical protein